MTHLDSKYLYNIQYFSFYHHTALKTFFIIAIREAAPKSQERFLDPDNLHCRFCTSNRFRPFFLVTDLGNFQTQGVFPLPRVCSSELFQGNDFEETCWVSGFR